MIHIEGEIVINRPPEEVFDVVADERNEPKYNPRCFVLTSSLPNRSVLALASRPKQ